MLRRLQTFGDMVSVWPKVSAIRIIPIFEGSKIDGRA